MSKKQKSLIADSVKFYSPIDEDVFFSWLDKINFIISYEGFGTELHLNLDLKYLDAEGLSELTALFMRYSIDRQQLASLEEQLLSKSRLT